MEVQPTPCSGVTCSGHGTCSSSSGSAQCSCNSGYQASGLTCVATMTSTIVDVPGQGTGKTYFVSPSGSDGNNGLSSTAAFATINHAETLSRQTPEISSTWRQAPIPR